MTPQEIDALPAGRELDVLVAERVMGLVQCTNDCHKQDNWPSEFCWGSPETSDMGGELKSYSTDIAAAWEVVEKLQSQTSQWGTRFQDGATVRAFPAGGWYVGFTRGEANAETAPLAICRAALRAVMRAVAYGEAAE